MLEHDQRKEPVPDARVINALLQREHHHTADEQCLGEHRDGNERRRIELDVFDLAQSCE
jgi:hypothetical protein